MRKIRDILRLRFECRLTIRQISVSLRISTGVITKYLNLFSESGLSWPLPNEMDDTSLINQLTPEAINRRYQGLIDPDWIDIHRSLKQKGMTKQVLWEEYCDVYPHSHYSLMQDRCPVSNNHIQMSDLFVRKA